MASIEVKRTDDGNSKTFNILEISDGTLVNWVTENDSNADGLVRFLNQVQGEGNALSPSIDRYPKIVKNGSLVTDGNGNPTVEWDGKHDGYEINFDDYQTDFSSEIQTLQLKISPEKLKGTPKTILNSDGFRIWEMDGKIHAGISNPNTQWEQLSNAPGNIRGFASYKGDMYLFSQGDNDIYRFDNGTFVNETRHIELDLISRFSLTTYNDKLWSFDSQDGFWTFTGTKRFKSFDVRSDGKKAYFANAYKDSPIIEEYDLSVPFDFSTCTKINTISSLPDLDGFLTGIRVRSDGKKLYLSTFGTKQVYEYDLGVAWDLSTSLFVQKKDVSSDFDANTDLRGLEFNSDGTKCYLIEEDDGSSNGGRVFEYNLTISWDISTLQFSQAKDVSNESNEMKGLFFREDGEKLYLISNTPSRVYEYDLSQSYDISTASFSGNPIMWLESPGFLSEQAKQNARSLFFNPNGNEFYAIGGLSGEVGTYNVTTSWQINSSYFIGRDVVDEDASGWIYEHRIGVNNGMYIRPDGKKLYTADSIREEVKQYHLSSAWDITTAEEEGAFHLNEFENSVHGVWLKDDGSTLYFTGDGTGTLWQFNLEQNWDITTAIYSGYKSKDFSTLNPNTVSPQDIFFRSDGEKLYVADFNGRVDEFDLGTPWDVTTLSYIDSIDISNNINNVHGIYFQPNGEKAFVTGKLDMDIAELDLSTPWNIASATFGNNITLPFSENAGQGLMMKPNNGDTLFLSTESLIYQYDLSADYDLTTATLNDSKLLEVQGFMPMAAIPYENELFVIYRGGALGTDMGGVIKKSVNGNWDHDFLTPVDIKVDLLGDPVVGGKDVDIFGGGVWRDEVYISLFSANPSESEGETILKYNNQDGWEVFFTFGSPTNTSPAIDYLTTTPPYDDKLYALPSEGSAVVYDESDQTFKQSWEVNGLPWQSVSKAYDGDLYVGHSIPSDDAANDAIYKWDGENFDVEFQTGPGGAWKALGIHKGQLWAAHRFITGEVYRKGEGEEISVNYDTNKKEIKIEAAVTKSNIYLDVDGTIDTKSHNINYKQTGKFRTGLSYGPKMSDQHAGVDEVYKGSLKEVIKYNTLTKNPFDTFYSSVSAPTVVFRSPTSINGTASFPNPEIVDTYEVLASPNGTQGSFSIIKTDSDPSNTEITWQHSGLSQGEDYFYKFRISRPGTTLTSPTVSAVADYIKPDPPTIAITSTETTEVSGTIDSDQEDILWDKLEVYRATTSGGPYTLIESFTGINTEQTWTDTNLNPSTQYIYVGKAVNTAGPVSSDFSSEVSTTTSVEISGGQIESDLSLGLFSVVSGSETDLVVGTDSETEIEDDLEIGTN